MNNDINYTPWVEEYQWIGVVDQEDRKQNVTLITPLAYCDIADKKWQAIAENDCHRYFPNNGKIAHFTSDFSQWKVGRLLSFHPVRNNRDMALQEHDPRRSFYLTFDDLDFAPLDQILDWNCRTRELFDLPALLERGIAAEACLTRQVYIYLLDSLYGPIHLDPDRTDPGLLKPREYLQGSSTGGQPLLLSEYSFNKNSMVTLINKGFVNPESIGSPVRCIDLSLPQVVMKKVLQASNTISSNDLEINVRLVDRQIAKLASLSSPDGPDALRIKPYTLQRAQHIIAHQMNNLHTLQALIQELPTEHPLLLRARKLEIEQRKMEIEQEATKQCEVEQYHLRQLEEQVQRAEHQLQTLQDQAETVQGTLAEREKEIEQAVQKYERIQDDFGTLERFMHKRLNELRQEPLQLLADLHLLTALPSSLLQPVSIIATDGPKPVIVTEPPHEQPRFFTDEYALELSTYAGQLSSLPWKEAAKEGKVTPDDAKVCAAALLAGLLPAPDGPGAADVWLTTARVLTGGRIWSVPVPLTALSPLDLFGSIATDARLFIPTAGGLADIVLEALAHPTQLAIVILEGIDRIPTLPVLAPLLQLYRRARQHVQQGATCIRHSSSLNLFNPRVLTPDDPYQKLSSFTWPENLLLGVTFDHEPSSLPISEMYNSWFVRTELKVIAKHSGVSSQRDWQVSPTLWHSWEKELFIHTPKNQEEYEHLDQWQRQFYRSMEDLDIQEEQRDDLIEQLWPQKS